MYDELVKALRETDFSDGCPCEAEPLCKDKDCVIVQAADAIEELSRDLDSMNEANIALYGALPKWIPVSERLPEQKINQNTLDFEYVLCATTFGDVRPYKFGRRIGQGEPHFWNGAGYVDTYVTHWMPLPEPPKEEA